MNKIDKRLFLYTKVIFKNVATRSSLERNNSLTELPHAQYF